MAEEKPMHDAHEPPRKDLPHAKSKEGENDPNQSGNGVEPHKQNEEADKPKSSFKDYIRIFRYADRLDRPLLCLACISAILSGASLPFMALIFGNSTRAFSDYAKGQGDPQAFQNQVSTQALYFIYLFIGRFVVGYIGTLSICVAAARTTNSLRKAFLESLLRKEIAHFDVQGNGSVATQVTTNGARINAGIAEKLYNFVNGASLFFSAFIVALAVQPVLAIITMSIVPAIVVVIGASIGAMVPIETTTTRIYSTAATIAQDALGSIKTIFAFGAEKKILQWYEGKLQDAHREGKKKSLIFGPLFSAQYFFTLSGTALAFWQGSRMYQSGQISDVGKVLTVILSVTLGSSSVFALMGSIENITNATSAASELFDIIDRPSSLDPLAEDGKAHQSCVGEIELRNVAFAYPSRPSARVLHNLNISIPAGKTTALVGPSGCGKSTIVGLLERWYQPDSGQILIDGYDISDLNIKWLRNSMRLVQQEPTLFTGNVYDNVFNGLSEEQRALTTEAQKKLVEDACIAADAHEFISRLPQGYHTQLGERGGMLSGGQLQRISIARSIISSPQILLCDEATSALDPRAENVVQEALGRVSKNKTTLIIAHKLATVMAADNIAVMNNGTIVEQGTHKQLLELDGLYAAMVRAQDLGKQSDLQEPSLGSTLDHPPEQDRDTSKKHYDHSRSRDNATISQKPMDDDEEVGHLTTGTLDYSLIRCIWIMLKENTNMYPWYFLISVAYILVGGTYPVQAVLFSRTINVFTLQGEEAKDQANFYSLMFFVLALVNLVGYFFVGISVNTIGQNLTHRYRHEMLERMLSFDLDFFDCPENSSGALAARLSSVPSAVQELMSTNLGLLLTVLVNMISTSVLGIAFGWKLGVVMVFGGMTVIVGSGLVRIRLDQRLEAQTEAQFSKSASLAAETVGAIRTVNSLTMERSVLQEYGDTLDAIVSQVARSLIPVLIPYTFSQSAEFLVLALGFWYGSRLTASGEYTTTQFFTIFIAIVFGGQAAAQLFTYTTSITRAKGNANYILWLRTIKSNIQSTAKDNRDPPDDGQISLTAQKVTFSYKQRREARVLRDLSMTIKAGSYAAFVGPSGCGKSTVVSLLERFYDPTSGSVLMNGTNIKHCSVTGHRDAMSLVQQNPPLYLGSVRDNIAIGLDREPTEEEIRQACEQANARDFITSLPDGLNTQCGSRGLQFSGGQRQRIAVARALIRQPRLLLLDEATSALDTQSERLVQDALNKASSTRTTISVAHRLSTIRHADVIFVIEDGRIAEMGTHDELIGQRGRYHAMCLAQSLDQA